MCARIADSGVSDAIKGLIGSSFTDEVKAYWTEGTIDAALDLCRRAGAVLYNQRAGFLVAYFRYWPAQGKYVEAMDFAELDHANLSGGPLLHFVVWISPIASYRIVRGFIKELQPWGVTCHRWTDGDFRFAARRNAFFKDGGRA